MNGEALREDVRSVQRSHGEAEAERTTLENECLDGSSRGKERTLSSPSSMKFAGQAIAPFLAKHIPNQYAPLGGDASQQDTHNNKELSTTSKDPNSKFCYRHRPDLKCRRQADEPSMDQLQKELEQLPPSDQQAIAHVWSVFSAAPSKHRNIMLNGILAQCCFPQLSFLSASVRELIRIDFISALPPEISFRILCYLDTTSLCKAAQVSHRWRCLADDDVVWHRMCEQHIDRKCTKCGWGLPLLERKRLRATRRQIQLRANAQGLAETSPCNEGQSDTVGAASSQASNDAWRETEQQIDDFNKKRASDEANLDYETTSGTSGSESPVAKRQCTPGTREKDGETYYQRRTRPWKDVYKDRFKVGTNWKYGRCTTKVLRGHTNGVMCLQFDDSILATGSYDATIKLWDIETGEELRTLRGHDSGIRALQFDDTKLISGSMDRSLKVWNWRTGECLSTYAGHTGGVIGLHFDGNILASGSIDKTIKIWNFEDKSTFLLRGHTDWVNAVKVDSASRTVFSASDDCSAKLWDLDTKRVIRTFEGHTGQVQQVIPLPPEFEMDEEAGEEDGGSSGSGDDAASSTGSASSSTSQPDPPPHAAVADENNIVVGAPWDDSFGADRPIPPRYMLTGALDNTIRLWDVAAGKCLRTFFGHMQGIWALAADTLRIVSGAQDRTVKVWDPRTGKCERTFTGHLGPVTCIWLSDSRLCSGSEDCEVRLHSFKPES